MFPEDTCGVSAPGPQEMELHRPEGPFLSWPGVRITNRQERRAKHGILVWAEDMHRSHTVLTSELRPPHSPPVASGQLPTLSPPQGSCQTNKEGQPSFQEGCKGAHRLQRLGRLGQVPTPRIEDACSLVSVWVWRPGPGIPTHGSQRVHHFVIHFGNPSLSGCASLFGY